MLFRNEVTHASDLDLLTVLIGDRSKATKLLSNNAVFALCIAPYTTTPER